MDIKLEPALFFLGFLSKGFDLNPSQHTLVATQCVLFQWIKDKPPTVTQWYRELYKVLEMETLSATLKENDTFFSKIWQPVLEFLPYEISNLLQRDGLTFRVNPTS